MPYLVPQFNKTVGQGRMGKNTGGVTDWHKQQHKKRLIKNKESRIAARDERVVQEKTVQDIRAEIRKIEQHHKNEQQRPHAIQSKLDRLKKELKLVTAKEEADKQQHELTLQQQRETQKYETKNSFIPLARPEVSIYYDALMNPYGAPPPGQPRLYHRRGGGTTANLDEACSLQEQFLPPPPPPPPRPCPTFQQHQRQPQKIDSRQNSNRQSKVVNRDNFTAAKSATVTKSNLTEKASIDPSQLPDLPAPSAAVVRSKRNKLSSDIWASGEEIQYEESVSAVSLEGIASTVLIHTQWYYKDLSGATQGPFSTDQMRQWNRAGYFLTTTLVSGTNNSGPWKALKDIKQLREHDAATLASPGVSTKTEVSSSVQDRIAALRGDESTLKDEHVDDESTLKDEYDDDEESAVQLRIAALKALSQRNTVVDDDNHATQNRIVSLNGQQNVGASITVESQSESSKLGAVESIFINDNAEFNDQMASSDHDPLPPPPPAASENDVKLRENLLAYPVDDENIVSYPIDDYTTDLDNYEADDDTYPPNEEDIPVTGDYNYADDEYLVHELANYTKDGLSKEANSLSDDREVEQPKKRIKVDEAVVALVPSRVRKRQQ